MTIQKKYAIINTSNEKGIDTLITITDDRDNRGLTFSSLGKGEAFISIDNELFIVTEESNYSKNGSAVHLKTGHTEMFEGSDLVIPVNLEIIVTDGR